MLEILEKRAGRAGVLDTIQTHLCKDNEIGIAGLVDFALAFWMVHETPDKKEFLHQVRDISKDSGLLLITEPKFHISRSQFEHEIDIAKDAGFRIKDESKIAFSHSVLLEKV